MPLLAQIASFDLMDGEPLEREPLEIPRWNALLGEAFQQRMEGTVASAVAEGALPVSDPQLAELRQAARTRASLDLLAERETVRTAAVLEEAGLPYRMLKGPALAHSVYRDPMLRSFGDVDVLVEPWRWDDAVRVLEASGASRLFPEVRPGFDARFGKDATFVAGGGREIDLHRTLAAGPYGLWIDCRDLFSRPPTHVTLGGRPVAVLDAGSAFVHACYNATLVDDPPRLSALRDVAQMATAAAVDPEDAYELARRWRATAVVRRSLQLAASHLGLDLARTPLGRRFAGKDSTGDRILLATYRGQGRGYTSQLTGVVAVPGPRAKAAYLYALAHPQRAYLEARGFTASGFLTHGLRRVRRPR